MTRPLILCTAQRGRRQSRQTGPRATNFGPGPGSKPTPVDFAKIVFKQPTIKGIYGRQMFETWNKMIAMLRRGLDVRKVITHRMSARDFQQSFEIMRLRHSGKIVLAAACAFSHIAPGLN